MKRLIVFLSLFILSATIFSQGLPIKFKANQHSSIDLGREFNFETSWSPLKNLLNVSFDGKILKMYYDTGKEYAIFEIINYVRKDKKTYDRLDKELFILTIKDKEFYNYIVIIKDYETLRFSNEILFEIKIPFMIDGVITSYKRFQSFPE